MTNAIAGAAKLIITATAAPVRTILFIDCIIFYPLSDLYGCLCGL